ncbi:hypothetical protein DFH08DRAFT_700045 [Mycena albidolilacea]|uniref:Uncharacterized protein n=1 Tax=Mycena albidolilacea TaxID=1033008 RepID=A0AAD7EQL4_9AGAR|nr:hypothetical protein DFH08DRAFT_700045 [Mycena albidolilacea]
MQARCAQHSLVQAQSNLKGLSVWNANKGHIYLMETRRLVLRIAQAGCPESKIKDVILSCIAVFSVNVLNLTLSARTVGRMKKEGGYIALIQIGREITMTYSFTESSDGTSHCKISFEYCSLSTMLPTYAPGVDDTDPATWKPRTQFLEVETSLSHTLEVQLDGTKMLAAKIADATMNAPSSISRSITMDWKDWFRKQLAQMADHAADQGRKHELTSELKHSIIIEDLGEQESGAFSIAELFDALLAISEEEIQKNSGKDYNDLTPLERSTIARSLVDAQLGEETYNALSDDLKALADFLIFGGCCSHKDMNTFKYGCKKMEGAWPEGEEPVLLANKANSTTIRLGERDSTVVQAAEHASLRGVIKAMALLGALFRHKDEDKGYQDKYLMFMQKELGKLCSQKHVQRFPATSQTRYGAYGRAAAVVTQHYTLLLQLISIFCDGKTKAGANHIKESALKALNCPRTMAEIVAAALYSLCISWPYMKAVRKKDGNGMLPNLLDLVDIHHRLPSFCRATAANPSLLLDHNIADSSKQLTLDGEPFHDTNVLLAAQVLAPDLPDVAKMIAAMFSGAADGWNRFTPEFAVGGPVDSIPDEIRAKLYIPATNDHNEGGLRSWCVHIRFHPHSTPRSFSTMERYRRNNTEAFAAKYITADDVLHVMREVRKEDASGANTIFRQAVVEELEQKAISHREKVNLAAEKKSKKEETLRATGVEQNRETIARMTILQLKVQFDVYKCIVKDAIILKTTLVSIPRRADKLQAVLAALDRYEA